MTSLRLAILGFVVVVMAAAHPAEARRGRGGIVVINLGDDIPSPPRVETDPFRAPPKQAPIHVERPSAPVVAPIAVDPDAEAPKLLT